MLDIKKYVMAGGTFAAILGIGFFMQSGPSENSPKGVISSPVPVQVNKISDEVELTDITHTSGVLGTAGMTPKIPGVSVIKTALSGAQSVDNSRVAAPSCDINMTAEPTAAALVNLRLTAPCLPNEQLMMHHNGMMFSEVTDKNGALEITVPALAQTAVFIASFANGDGAVANTKVSSIEFYDRAVVQSKTGFGFEMHALEFGATYDDAGHISAISSGEIAAAAAGTGGFLIHLGAPGLNNAMVAEVYSFPTGIAQQDGDIEISVEVEVTANNCGKNVEAQAMQTIGGARLKVQIVDMQMPDCDAIGDFLVMKNLIADLVVASN